MKHSAILVVSALICAPVIAQEAPPAVPSAGRAVTAEQAPNKEAMQKARSSEGFVNAAVQAGMLEVELGKMAASKATSEAVREYGRDLAQDHYKANEELKKIAQATNTPLPSELDAAHRAKANELANKSGAEFDTAYTVAMVKGHREAIALFREAGNSANVHRDLQSFAKRTLPTLQEHETKAKQLDNRSARVEL